MKAKKKVAAICLTIGAVLLLLTAFSGVNAWNQEEDGGSTGGAAGPVAAQAALLTGTDENSKAEESVLSDEPVGQENTEAPSEETGKELPADSQAAGDAEEAEPSQAAGTAKEENTAESDEETGEAGTDSEAQPEEGEPAEEMDYFAGQFMVTVTGKTALNVREEPNTDSKWVGKMYAGSGGYILETADGWSKIKSDGVTGWVSNDYIVTGEEGRQKALAEGCDLVIEVESDALKVRSAPTTEEENKLRAIYGGEMYSVVSVQEGWVEIEYSEGKTGWVASEYVTIRYSYDFAVSRKAIEEAELAKKRVSVSTTTRASQSASVDEVTLLACLIQCESGSYEGQLAVANVILNRVNSSKYPNSITEVIYAAGQFSPVRSGKLDSRLSKGPSATALQAANDALGGTNNIGDFLHFRSAKGADLSSYSAYTIVAGNCFYRK